MRLPIEREGSRRQWAGETAWMPNQQVGYHQRGVAVRAGRKRVGERETYQWHGMVRCSVALRWLCGGAEVDWRGLVVAARAVDREVMHRFVGGERGCGFVGGRGSLWTTLPIPSARDESVDRRCVTRLWKSASRLVSGISGRKGVRLQSGAALRQRVTR